MLYRAIFMNLKATRATTLITGASGGIGYELAKLFGRDGHNLALVARSGDSLAQVARELESKFGVAGKTVALNLATPPAPKFLYDQLQREGVVVDIVVNNAGFGVFGEFAQMPQEEIAGQIDSQALSWPEKVARWKEQTGQSETTFWRALKRCRHSTLQAGQDRRS